MSMHVSDGFNFFRQLNGNGILRDGKWRLFAAFAVERQAYD